jgi:hypothetical protein
MNSKDTPAADMEKERAVFSGSRQLQIISGLTEG